MACVCAWFISLNIVLFKIIYDIWRSMRQGMCCHPGQVLTKVNNKTEFQYYNHRDQYISRNENKQKMLLLVDH